MLITDYETGREVRDLCVALTPNEAEELMVYLERLLAAPEISRIYLSEIRGCRFEREVTLRLLEPRQARRVA